MLKTNQAFLSLIFVASLACTTKENGGDGSFTFANFQEKTELKGTKFIFKEILVPLDIFFKNDNLIISDVSGLALLHQVDAVSMDYIQEMAQVGWGPGEIPSVGYIRDGIEKKEFWVYSPDAKLLASYTLHDTTRLYKKSIKSKEKMHMATAISQTNQNEFIGYTINAEEHFLVFDSLGNVVKSIGRCNELMPELGMILI